MAIGVFGLIACLTILPGQATFLGQVYAFGAMLSFTIAHVSVVALRLKEPDRERPYRGPGAVHVRGRALPLFALAGGLGTGIAWVVVTVLNLKTLIAGVVWLAIGIATYIVYRRRQGLSLTTTTKVVVPKAIVEREVEYESVLVAFEDGQYSSAAVSTAVKLAARRRRGIHVLVTITMPHSVPIDASMPEAERRAQSTIDSARVLGRRRVTGHWEKVRPGEAGRRIVDEARMIRARAVVMAVPRRPPGGTVLGRTIETVLQDRPCRIIVESEPAGGAPSLRAAA
jgi:APA family basic amino acid/polyamine antiporter